MHDIRISRQTEEDLVDIWLYTNDEWGSDQADEYLRQIDTGISRLVEYPELGKDRNELREGYRSLSINHHIAFYIVQKNEITIVRILHENSDLPSHL